MSRPRRLITTKRVVLIVVCAVLGIATSYGVAWWYVPWATGFPTRIARWNLNDERSLGASSGFGWESIGFTTSGRTHSKAEARRHFALLEQASWEQPWNLIARRDPSQSEESPPDRPNASSARLVRGIPFRCVIVDEFNIKFSRGISFVLGVSQVPCYPYLPLWPGLLANTAIYGGAWFVILAGVPAGYRLIRARRRSRKGKCATCGYDRTGLADDAVCPECGASADRKNPLPRGRG